MSPVCAVAEVFRSRLPRGEGRTPSLLALATHPDEDSLSPVLGSRTSAPVLSPWRCLSLHTEYSNRPAWRIISLAEPSQDRSR